RKAAVVDAARVCWHAYKRDAFGADEYMPISRKGASVSSSPRGIGYMIADSLDTLWLAGLKTEYQDGVRFLAQSVDFDVDAPVSVFETTIRVLGGLLSAHALSGDKVLLEKARLLGDRLLPAFNTASGLPATFVNLARGTTQFYGRDETVNLAEAGTLQLEFNELSRATDDSRYRDAAQRAADVIAQLPTLDGLAPTFFNVDGKRYRAVYKWGASADSYYEYLLKRWLQLGRSQPKLRAQYDAAVRGARMHLLKTSPEDKLAYIGDMDDNKFVPVFEHLTCFAGGMLALGAMTMSDQEAKQRDLDLARDLTRACDTMYSGSPSGLAPERVRFSAAGQTPAPNAIKWSGTADMYAVPDERYSLLRPETVESMFILWRATGNVEYREQGWRIFEAMRQHAKFSDDACLVNVADVAKVPTPKKDKVETFFMAETLKYLLLLFDDDANTLSLDRFVFNTEAHPLPIF
ncbi:class I Alpha1,2-mannosidase, partial [Thamnocephalis sphaerospora]